MSACDPRHPAIMARIIADVLNKDVFIFDISWSLKIILISFLPLLEIGTNILYDFSGDSHTEYRRYMAKASVDARLIFARLRGSPFIVKKFIRIYTKKFS